MSYRTFLSVNLNDIDSRIQNLPILKKTFARILIHRCSTYNTRKDESHKIKENGIMKNLHSGGNFSNASLTRPCATCPATAQWLNNPPSHYPASQ